MLLPEGATPQKLLSRSDFSRGVESTCRSPNCPMIEYPVAVSKTKEKPMSKLARYYWTIYLATAWLLTL
jgi:hypothetical protein